MLKSLYTDRKENHKIHNEEIKIFLANEVFHMRSDHRQTSKMKKGSQQPTGHTAGQIMSLMHNLLVFSWMLYPKTEFRYIITYSTTKWFLEVILFLYFFFYSLGCLIKVQIILT